MDIVGQKPGNFQPHAGIVLKGVCIYMQLANTAQRDKISSTSSSVRSVRLTKGSVPFSSVTGRKFSVSI